MAGAGSSRSYDGGTHAREGRTITLLTPPMKEPGARAGAAAFGKIRNQR